MAGMIYMYVEGATGEEPLGNDDLKPELIKLSAYRHGLDNEISPIRPSIGEGAALQRGQCRHGDFVVEKELDFASPQLLRLAEASVLIPRVTVYLFATEMKKGKSALTPFLTIELADSVLASFEYGSTGKWPSETLRFRYSSIKWQLDWKNLEDGKPKGTFIVGWDGAENKTNAGPKTTPPAKPA